MKRVGRRPAFWLVAAAVLCSQVLSGATLLVSWDGGGGNDRWGTSANWNPDTLNGPNNGASINIYVVTIDLTGAVVRTVSNGDLPIAITISGLALGTSTTSTLTIVPSSSLTLNLTPVGAGTVTVGSGGVLNIQNSGTFAMRLPATGGTLTNAGVINLESSGTLTGLVFTGGTLTLAGGGTVTLTNNANNVINGGTNTFVNASDTIAGAGQINVGSFFNAGTVIATGSAGLAVSSNYTNSGNTTINSGGTLSVATGNYTQTGGTTDVNGTLVLTGPGTLTLAGGTLMGAGTVTGTVNAGSATINPGASPGTLSITGNYIAAGGTTLVVEIGGNPGSGNFDLLLVGGSVTLAGFVDPLAFGGYTFSDLVPGVSKYAVVTCTGGPNCLTGSFTLIGPASQLFFTSYDGSNAYLTFIPEPATGLLVLAGLGGLLGYRRLKRRRA